MLKFKYLLYLAEASLLYNHIILMSVTLNAEWVKTRAAGGQYESFPPTLRVIYFVMAAFMITLAIWLWDHREQKLNSGSKRLAKILSATFAISMIFQLISRSPDERWNAIPAFILAFTFFRLVRDSK